MTRVLVTGATGLIGRTLVPALRVAGHIVHTTARSGLPGGYHEPADLSDPQQVAALLDKVRPDVITHLAGGPAADRLALLRGNVHTTSTLLQGLARTGRKLDLLVVTGSAAEYGEGDGEPLSEDVAPSPLTPYGQAKHAQHQVVQLMAPAVARRSVHVRPFNVLAPDLPASSALGNLRRQLLAGDAAVATEVVCGRLDILRDFVPIEDVASVLVGVLALVDPPDVLNACSGSSVLLADLAQEVIRQSGRSARLVPDPALVDLPAARQVVGDPARLMACGLHRPVDLARLAAVLLRDGRQAP